MDPREPRKKAEAILKRLFPRAMRHLTDDHWDDLDAIDASFNDIRGPIRVDMYLGKYAWIVVTVVLFLPILLTWHLGVRGLLAGVLMSIAIVYGWRAARAMYTNECIYPSGGYYEAQRRLERHSETGSQLHQITRMILTYRVGRFVYSGIGPRRLSWRVYALGLLVLLALNWSPIVGASILCLVLGYVLYAFTESQVPVALYLGPSSFGAMRLFWRIRNESGIRWASLLKDPLELPEQLQGSSQEKIDAMLIGIYSNPWSLRCDSNPDWLSIVRDFIDASIIIVIKIADVPAVIQELDILRVSHPLARIVCVVDDPRLLNIVPSELKPAIMCEADAMALVSRIGKAPRTLLPMLRERLRLFPAP